MVHNAGTELLPSVDPIRSPTNIPQPQVGGNILPQVDNVAPSLTPPSTPIPGASVAATVDDTELKSVQRDIEQFDTDISSPITPGVPAVTKPQDLDAEEPPVTPISFTDTRTIKPVTAFDVRGVKNRERDLQLQTVRNATPFGSPRQRRILSERKGIEDHYDVSFIQPATQTTTRFRVSPTGSIANGQLVGQGRSKDVDLTRQRLDESVRRTTQYAVNFNRMSDFQRSAGAVDTFYGIVRPYLGTDDLIPSTQLVSDTVGGLNIGLNWSRYGDINRFIKTANSLHGISRDLGYKIPKNATNSLALLNFGYSSYNMLNNWDRMSPEQRAVSSLNTINSGAQAYTAGSTLVNSFSGTAAAGSAGASGAASTAGGTSPILQAVPYVAAAVGAYTLVDQWGRGGAGGRVNGASSGAAIGGMFGPWGMAIGSVVGVALGSIRTGKSSEQSSRDALRDHFEKANIFEKKDGVHFLELADGSFYNVGVDGSGGRATMSDGSVKTYADPTKIPERDRNSILSSNELRPYDIDFTNDLDFVTSLSTKLMNLIPVGGTVNTKNQSEAAQMNGYLTNAATSNVGREFTPDNFSKVMDNVRTQYEKVGIRDKVTALNVANNLREQRRLSNDDYNAIVLGIEFSFSENFDRASQLLIELNRGEVDTTSAEEFKELQRQDKATAGIQI